MGEHRVVVTDDRFGSYEEEKSVLSGVDCTVEVAEISESDDPVLVFEDADALLVNLFPLTREIVKRLPKCRIISRYGVGVDNVDVAAATEAGIWVARVPDYGYEEVSDHALALLLGCIRNIVYVDRRIRDGAWNLKDEYRAMRVKGRILGLIGFGLIGRALYRKVQGLELSQVLVCDPYIDQQTIRDAGAVPADLKTVLEESDYLSIHAPLTPETRGLIGKEQIQLMKPTAIIVNTSRGGIISESALAEALAGGDLGAAGLDVFEHEPIPSGSPLLRLDNVILTDHTGYYSEESIVELKTKAAQNILEVFAGRKPLYPVNEPNGR